MTIHFLKRDNEFESTPFEEYEIHDVEEMKSDEAWYWYERDIYDGCGYILFRRGNKYNLYCCNHCSCYGPTENLKLEECEWISREKLFNNATEELKEEIKILYEAAMKDVR